MQVNEAKLRVGFLLMPRFTLTAFAGFIDALRLAADDGDLSRPRLCHWEIIGTVTEPVMSSCGVGVLPTVPYGSALNYDYLIVVGGLMHGGQPIPSRLLAALHEAASNGINLVGLCTGSFVLARAKLLDGYLACVSWYHQEEFANAFPNSRVVSNQLFVVDRDRLTCAGGTSVVHLAANLIEKAIDRASAMRALRTMLEHQPLPSRSLQPEAVVSCPSSDTMVHKAMLLLEQHLQSVMPMDKVCETLNIGRRQLERRFRRDVGLSPAEYRQRLRIDRARWLLKNTDLDVIEISMECGFQDSTHFSRLIKKALGATPRQLRSQE